MATLAEVEDAVEALLKAKLQDGVRKIAIQKGFEGIVEPGVYVSVAEGRFEKASNNSYRQFVTLSVGIIFRSLKDEATRRKGIYPILEGCVQLLLLQRLGLDITPILPKSFHDGTDAELLEKGLLAFVLELETSWYICKMDEAEGEELLKIGLQYYLRNLGAEPNTVYDSDLVEFTQGQ